MLLSSPSSSCIGDRAAISVPASSSSPSSSSSLWHCWLNSPCFTQMTLNAFVVSLQGKKKEKKKQTYRSPHLLCECGLHSAAYNVGLSQMSSLPVPLDRRAPSPSRLLGEKSGQFGGFRMCLHFLSTPSFFPSASSRSRSDSSDTCRAEQSRASGTAASALTQDSRTAASWEQLTGKYFFFKQPRSQSILHHPKNAAEKNPVGFYFFFIFFLCIYFFIVVWGFSVFISLWCCGQVLVNFIMSC